MTKIILSLEKPKHFQIAYQVKDFVDGWKVNHIGLDYISQSRFNEWAKLDGYTLAREREIFFDCKLWDTPNTVKTVVEKFLKMGASMATISTYNSEEVFEELKEYHDKIKLLGVTYPTSWTAQDQYEITREMPDQMWKRAIRRCKGFYGMVCSPLDIVDIKHNDIDEDLKTICPGITLPIRRAAPSGQVRTTTPKEAQDLGADYIVIGRTITDAKNPVEIAKKIKKTLDISA